MDFKWYESEKVFTDPNAMNAKKPFPSIKEAPTLQLSVIVPAYNEEKRLPIMMDECLEYFSNRVARDSQFTYEIIIVDDGSKDRTTSIGLEYSKQFGTDKIRVLTLQENRGKGGAIRLGVLNSRGKLLLMADADGASKFADLEKLEAGMNSLPLLPMDYFGIAIGSRAHLEKEAIATRSGFRTFLMHAFHFMVWLFCVRTIRDTQCGFKLFTRDAAKLLFPNLHVERWAFDVELLFMAEVLKIPIVEVSITWTEIDGSKIVPFWSWAQMGRDLLLIWLWHYLGVWKVELNHKFV